MFDKFKQLGKSAKLVQEAMKMQKMLAAEEMAFEEDGIKVVITGEQKIKEIEVDGGRQDRLVRVLNQAITKSQRAAAEKIAQMGGGLSGLLNQG